MKINLNGGNGLNEKSYEKEKEQIRSQTDVLIDDPVASNPSKCAIDKEAPAISSGSSSTAHQRQSNSSAPNGNSDSYYQMLLYKQRMDRGLFCALTLIIVLCVLGMATSIGGAIYLKFRSNHSRSSVGPLPYHQHLVSLDRINSTSKATQIHIRLTLPDSSSLAEVEEMQTTEPSSAGAVSMDKTPMKSDPYEDVIWDELRRQHGLGGMSSADDIDSRPMASDNQMTVVSTTTETSTMPNFTSVSKHRLLQEGPTLSDFITFIRRALRIPTIKIVRDHE